MKETTEVADGRELQTRLGLLNIQGDDCDMCMQSHLPIASLTTITQKSRNLRLTHNMFKNADYDVNLITTVPCDTMLFLQGSMWQCRFV